MRRAYLKTQRPVLYEGYVAHGTLFEHCAEVETQARQRLDVMMKQIAQEWGISEEMKSTDPLGWAGLMNQARHCADEIILNELIYCRQFRSEPQKENNIDRNASNEECIVGAFLFGNVGIY